MIDKQLQDVGDGSLALQVKGDLTINQGLQISDVKELCILFLQQNFPKLREEAIEAARKNVESYIPVFTASIARQAHNIDVSKISDPDIQASINESVQAAARKGKNANLPMLAELVSTRMRSDTSQILSVVAEEAILLVPRLTSTQISYLALCFYLNRMLYPATTIENFDIMASLFMPIVKNGFNISNSNLRHTEYIGASSVMNMVESNYYGILLERYPFLASEQNLHDAISQRAPVFHTLCEQYRISKVYNVTLTSVGELIAIMAINNATPIGLNPTVWIN